MFGFGMVLLKKVRRKLAMKIEINRRQQNYILNIFEVLTTHKYENPQ